MEACKKSLKQLEQNSMEDIATSILAFRHHVNAIRSHLRKKVTLKNNKDMEEKKLKKLI